MLQKNLPNVLVSKEYVGVDDGSVDDESVCTRKNSDHVLKDSKLEAFLQACAAQMR